jgi:hypothetical protein
VTAKSGPPTKPAPDGSVVPQADAAKAPDSSPDRRSDAPMCANTCLFGATVCTSDGLGVRTCELQATGCTAWGPVVACSAHESCQGSQTPYGSTALCACLPSICMTAGSICDGNGDVGVCAVDESGCAYEQSVSHCAAPNVCFYTACTPALADAVCKPACEEPCAPDGSTSLGCGPVEPDAGCGCPGWSLCQVCGP